MDAQHTKHVTYKLAYHFVWCPKYRKKILVGKLAAFIEQEIRRLCEVNTRTIGALNVQADHVHLFLSASPNISPSQLAHTLKGTTARKVFQHFPEVKQNKYEVLLVFPLSFFGTWTSKPINIGLLIIGPSQCSKDVGF